MTEPANDITRRFKDVFSRLASGVCVVSFHQQGRVHGFTATSVTSVSLDPPRVLFCLARSSDSHAGLGVGSAVGISVLDAAQQELSERFARSFRGESSYDDVSLSAAIRHAPVLDGAIGQIAATVVQMIPSGDHSILICDVADAKASDDGEPLLYCKRSYHRLSLGL